MAALALPLETITAAARPPVAARWARLTCTGAAAARLDGEDAGGRDRLAVVGGHEGQVGRPRRLDPARHAGGHEARAAR